MSAEPFIVTEASTWFARGRTPEHAEALARAWRDFPDLPATAPLFDRMARTRERTAAMRPITEAQQRLTEEARQAGNFAFLESKAAAGQVDDRELAILRGRDAYEYDWDTAVSFSQGWYAAHAGWAYRLPCALAGQNRARLSEAYDRGFQDGGGDVADLFDAARRANLAAARTSNQPRPSTPIPTARPLPSDWPKPSDQPRPARWSRRLVILSSAEFAEPGAERGRPRPSILDQIRARAGANEAIVIVLTAEVGFVAVDSIPAVTRQLSNDRAEELIRDRDQADRLRMLVGPREVDDILITAQGDYLRVIDAFANSLPLCRTMERTRNTPIQQQAHLCIWLDRGTSAARNIGAGHIRWGKVAKGLTGKLGEFTARYRGKVPGRGHLITVEVTNGSSATGYVDTKGMSLAPEFTVSNKAQLRSVMAGALRAFGGATRLSAAADLSNRAA